MVLALLTEVVALHMQMAIVQVGIPGFKRLIQDFFPSFGIKGPVSDPFDTSLHEFLEMVVVWTKSKSRLRTWSEGLKTRSRVMGGTPDGKSSTER